MAKSTAKRTYKLDLMTVLESIDKKDVSFYSNLTEEEKKGFAPRVVIRWLSTLSDNNPYKEYQLLAVNDLVNNGLYNLGKHPELQYLLMCVAGVGKKQYHQWIGTKSVSSRTPKTDALLTNQYGDLNETELAILRAGYDTEGLLKLASESGMDDKSLKELRDEQKKQTKSD